MGMARRPSASREPVADRPIHGAQTNAPTLGIADASGPLVPQLIIPWMLMFAASGCAALIYEIVWFQLLQFVIGSSAVSLGLLLAAYMGGLCLGSAALPKLVSARYHPMRVYALLELGIGAFGIIALLGV